MKSYHYYNRKNIFIIFLIIALSASFSKAENTIEKDFKELTSKLRCMTCQNQTIYESETDFSKDIKTIIRQKLINGENKNDIVDFIEMRYGEYILFQPKFDRKNIFLWTFPFIIFSMSALILFIRIRKNSVSK